MAARSLARRSVRVVLLEARDRVGGRAWSCPSARTATPAELGAEFIHGEAALTKRLLREAGMASVDAGGEGWTCAEDGALRLEDRGAVSAGGIFEGARTLQSDESVDRFLRRFDRDEASRKTARAARAFVEGFDAADPAIASVRAIAEEWRSGVDFAIARPLGGYWRLFDHLRETCLSAGVQMCQPAIVHRIVWRRGAVAVEVSRGRDTQTFHARTAILTVPVGVLRHGGDETAIVFDPDLPAAKIGALRQIEMGHVVKVVLWFRTAFWERLDSGRYRDASFFRCDGCPFPAFWTQVPVRGESVVAWAGGPKAIAFGGAAEDAVIASAINCFGRLFPDPDLARDEFDGGLMHDWTLDPFARGAYSYVRVGGSGAREALAAPAEDTLFFAGEATSTGGQAGTVNGALETGERAAAEAAAALGAAARRSRPG